MKRILPLVFGIGVLLIVVVFIYPMITKNNNSAMTESQSNQTSLSATTSTFTPPDQSTTAPQPYALADISVHATETDCWLVVEGKVYDVTGFVGKHPGGKAILNGCGKDATELFMTRPTNNKGPHPETARELLKTFQIGILTE